MHLVTFNIFNNNFIKKNILCLHYNFLSFITSLSNCGITEYPPHVYPSAPQFYRAHQLVQELSEVMVVIEAVKEDKRLKLAQQLVEEGKVVYALPAPYNSIHSEGSLNLIKNGAYCLKHYQVFINI